MNLIIYLSSVSELSSLEHCAEKHGLGDQVMDRCGDYISAALPTVMEFIVKCLDKRCTLLAIKHNQTPQVGY